MTVSPWDDPRVAGLQRELVDQQLAGEWPSHFRAFVDAVKATQCPGSIWEVGCASGYGRELLDRAGVSYASYWGVDISGPAIAIARERYPESDWVCATPQEHREARPVRYDVVIDGCALMHVDDWRAHLATLCAASRRWLILHRLPVNGKTAGRYETEGYGKTFPAWRFHAAEIAEELGKHGFVPSGAWQADGGQATLLYARPRHYACYFDSGYWPKARVMWESLRRHGGPAVLHALCWDAAAASLAEHAGLEVAVDMVGRHPELALAKLPGPPRNPVEHMWTCGPQHIVDVMDATGAPVTYVDADVMFHGSPEPLFAEAGKYDGFVIPHGFAEAWRGLPGPTVESHSIFGTYNVGLVHFERGVSKIAERWASACRNWCFERVLRDDVGGPLYGDQGYLNGFPISGARAIEHPGACLGPWAVHTRALDVRDGVIHFGGRPLVAYHYSSYHQTPHGGEQVALPDYALTPRQIEILYTPYREALNAR